MGACKKVDSRDCGGAVDFHHLQRILGFCDDFLKKPAAAVPCTTIAGFGGLQGSVKGAYLVYVIADTAVESTSETK